jgi:anti-sigma regulatory factor (Ser/Thr protein kinase)
MMEDLSLHILDIVENAVAAGATRVFIAVNENARRDLLSLRVSDNGRGMTPEERRRALDPFYTTGRKKTGLGLPLLAQTIEQSGGRLHLESAPGRGTQVTARFRLGHVDRPPLTKVTETMMTLIFGHPETGFRYRHSRNGSVFMYFRRGSPGGAVSPAEIVALRRTLESGLARIGAL